MGFFFRPNSEGGRSQAPSPQVPLVYYLCNAVTTRDSTGAARTTSTTSSTVFKAYVL